MLFCPPVRQISLPRRPLIVKRLSRHKRSNTQKYEEPFLQLFSFIVLASYNYHRVRTRVVSGVLQKNFFLKKSRFVSGASIFIIAQNAA